MAGRPRRTTATPKQLRIWRHILECVRRGGYQPSLTEISNALRIHRTQVDSGIRTLERLGYATRRPNKQGLILIRAVVTVQEKPDGRVEENPGPARLEGTARTRQRRALA